MNRIIIVGNGFDLAHDLETNYADFIEWYWKEFGDKLSSGLTSVVEDRLCSFKLRDDRANWLNTLHFLYPIINPLSPKSGYEVVETVKTNRNLCDFTIKSPFFEKICDEVETKNWVDIEDVYYEFLKKSDNPKQLNDDLDFIKNKLVEYLSSLPEPTLNPNIKDQILENIVENDIAIGSKDEYFRMRVTDPSFSPRNIMLLNFNYTSTADLYLPKSDKFQVNHIHGELSNLESVIFGYGDEHDDEYQPLMKKNDNEYLRHIKSFRYLEAANYRKMLSFIEMDAYQVCIMGHSCGVSDRTLLATLFEHPNCVSIKPYYHQKDAETDDYWDIVCNIARNISDPSLMRDRVVIKEHCEPLGQLSQNASNQ